MGDPRRLRGDALGRPGITGFGRFEELVAAVRCATPAGELTTLSAPASAAGPDLRALLLGSEGTLGAITELVLRVRPIAAARATRRGCSARSTPVRSAASARPAELAPDVARLADAHDTRATFALAGEGAFVRRAGGAALRALRYRPGCLLVAGWEGERGRHRPPARAGRAHAEDGGGAAARTRAGRGWRASRFAGPYLRDALLDRGVLVETLETATSWSALASVHGAVRAALEEALRATPPVVGCHISHVYPDGAALYFTVLARQDADDPRGQWGAAKRAAGDAMPPRARRISHPCGRPRSRRLAAGRLGALGIELLRAAKERCDPAGIMDPGKLLPG